MLEVVKSVRETIQSIEAVGNLVRCLGTAHAVVLESLSEAVEPSRGGLSIDLHTTDLGPDSVRSLAGPPKTVVGHFTVFIEHADEALAVNFFEVSAHLVHSLSRVAGHDGGVGESCKSYTTESLLY